MIKSFFLIAVFQFINNLSHAQFIATVELKEPIDGMCSETMFALFSSLDNQQQAKLNMTDQELIALMNEKIPSLKTNLKFKADAVMAFYINCESEVIKTSSGLKDKTSQLSIEIEKFLAETGSWTAGKYQNENVDCSELIAIKIKKGVIYLD